MDTVTGDFKARRSMVAMRKSIFGHCAGKVYQLLLFCAEKATSRVPCTSFSSEQERAEDHSDRRVPRREVLGQGGELRRGRWLLGSTCLSPNQYEDHTAMLFTSERHKREASQWVIFDLLLHGTISSQKPLEALEAYHHRLLRSLSSNMRSEFI